MFNFEAHQVNFSYGFNTMAFKHGKLNIPHTLKMDYVTEREQFCQFYNRGGAHT